MSIYEKIDNGTIILADQEEALKGPWTAYRFARLNIPGTDIEKCQEAVCKEPWITHCFALYIPGANIEKCQEAACKNTERAYCFARDIPEADIEYCRKACESDPELLKEFDKMIAEKVLA